MALRILHRSRDVGQIQPVLARHQHTYEPFTASFALSAIDATLSSTFDASCFADVDIACARPPALQKPLACVPSDFLRTFVDVQHLVELYVRSAEWVRARDVPFLLASARPIRCFALRAGEERTTSSCTTYSLVPTVN